PSSPPRRSPDLSREVVPVRTEGDGLTSHLCPSGLERPVADHVEGSCRVVRQLPFTWPNSPLFRNCFGTGPLLAVNSEREAAMAKTTSSRGKTGGSSNKATFDKIAKAAMSREMLAAGLN